MKQYMLSVHHAEGEPMPTPDVMQQMFEDVDAFNKEVTEAGAWVFGGGLNPIEDSRTVAPDGTVTDGPFAETKEYLGGYWVIQAADLDAALAWAAKGAAACRGRVEVRPFQDDTEELNAEQ